MGIYGDQLPNTVRLVAAGVAKRLLKDKFTSRELRGAIEHTYSTLKGSDSFYLYARHRLDISRTAAHRKDLAAGTVHVWLGVKARIRLFKLWLETMGEVDLGLDSSSITTCR